MNRRAPSDFIIPRLTPNPIRFFRNSTKYALFAAASIHIVAGCPSAARRHR
jgi:hypothetical protein